MNGALQAFQHLIIVPILLPLALGVVLVLINESRRGLKAALSLGGTLVVLSCGVLLMQQADRAAIGAPGAVYLLGNWPLPAAIALVADRLTALMLILNAVLTMAALLYATARWDRGGVHFHALFMFLFAGVNGAFLTNDLFNLFVFFEVMLAASYGLLLHGSGKPRVKAGLHYVVVNLVASSIFLIGVALIYAATGSLSMADIAVRVGELPDQQRLMLETGAAILVVAFLAKSAIWPLNFWLPSSYSKASPPVAAVFAILTKVGVYVIMRLWLLVFGDQAGAAAGFGQGWLMTIGLITLFLASAGLLAAKDLKRFAAFSVIVSSATLLTGVVVQGSAATAAALYYMLGSTLAIAAFFLLCDLLDRIQDMGSNLLAVTLEAFELEGMELPEKEEVGRAIPAPLAFLGVSFMICALVITGMPPLSGFVGKFMLIAAALSDETITRIGDLSVGNIVFFALLIVSGLAGVLGLMRLGIRAFWVPESLKIPRLRVIEVLPIAGLLGGVLFITVFAVPVSAYLQRTADALHLGNDAGYRILLERPVEAS